MRTLFAAKLLAGCDTVDICDAAVSRWIDKAQSGEWAQNTQGAWVMN